MADNTTIARPYAKAIFEHALAVDKLNQWSTLLYTLAETALNDLAVAFVSNPGSAVQQQKEMFEAVIADLAGAEKAAVDNLLQTLAVNKRLLELPAIFRLYEALREEHERILTVNVYSYAALTAEQEDQLQKMLTNRLKRQVSLNVSIDKALLGGALIQAGDLVIDGSVRGKLNKLGAGLAA